MNKKDSIYNVYRFWLKVEDLRGQEHEVKIVRAYLQTFFKKDERGNRLSFEKVCLSFENKKKDMYLDAQQAEQIERVTGTDKFAAWVGKTITLAADGGRIVIYAKPLRKADAAVKNVLVEVS